MIAQIDLKIFTFTQFRISKFQFGMREIKEAGVFLDEFPNRPDNLGEKKPSGLLLKAAF